MIEFQHIFICFKFVLCTLTHRRYAAQEKLDLGPFLQLLLLAQAVRSLQN